APAARPPLRSTPCAVCQPTLLAAPMRAPRPWIPPAPPSPGAAPGTPRPDPTTTQWCSSSLLPFSGVFDHAGDPVQLLGGYLIPLQVQQRGHRGLGGSSEERS